MKALVVDDDQITRSYLERLCKTLGWTVVGKESGEEALTIFQPRLFDIAIVDIDLGKGPDGVETAKEFRKRDKNMKIVLVSAESDNEKRAWESGVGCFLLKPPTMQALSAVVNAK